MAQARPILIVTGLSGLIGSRLSALAGERWDLVNADITEGIDITDSAAVLAVAAAHPDARALVHLAAFTDVSAAYRQTGDESGACWRVNVLGTRNVAAVCAEFRIPLIHISTDFVFDGEKYDPYSELDDPCPIEWYGRTKLIAEEEARAAGSWTICRIAFPYIGGPAPKLDLVRFIHSQLAGGGTPKLFTDQIITPTFADDVAAGVLLLAETGPQNTVFHLTGSSSLSPFDLGRMIAEVFGFDPGRIAPSRLDKHRKIDPRPRQHCLAIDNEKWSEFAQEHGLPAPLSIKEGLRKVKEAMCGT